MQLQFDPNQPFQIDAINAVSSLFQGQPYQQAAPQAILAGNTALAASPNRLNLSGIDILKNLQDIQVRNNIQPDAELKTLAAEVETANGVQPISFYNFSVEMETGTGKTYVYLRTAHALNQQYGFSKFIVVVPSVAVREGVLQTLKSTEAHFKKIFDGQSAHYFAYDSSNLSQVRQFALSTGIEIMVMTLAAFNKAANIIHQSTDRLLGETPVHLVQAARPILILDEPQNMESEKSIASLAALMPLFALRYSATHRNPYNIVYRLTPYEAYRQGLVKRIEVASILKENDQSQPYIQVVDILTAKKTVTARLTIHQRSKTGAVREVVVTVKPGDDLAKLAARQDYQGFVVDEINPAGGYIRFQNDIELAEGQAVGADKISIFEEQIRYTIKEHFTKQDRMKAAGIKVLSLFFIDKVDNYALPGAPIREMFNRAFDDMKTKYPEWAAYSPNDVQAAYFASRKTKAGELILEDSTSGEAEKDREAYDLIMKDKERLLSFTEPKSFIFSHSALREGWDNPNIFQICTLNQSISEVRKRQEVGRGVRLAVDQSGQRNPSEKINILTVIANESYEKFVTSLQSEIALEYRSEIEARYGKSIEALTDAERAEIAQEYGKGILPPKPANARTRGKAILDKQYTLHPDFQALWDQIRHKTRYSVNIDTAQLITDVIADLRGVDIAPPRIVVTKTQVKATDENVFEAIVASSAKSVRSLAGRHPLPNLVEIMSDQLLHTSLPIRLTRRTLLEIIKQSPTNCHTAIIENPHEFATQTVRIIKSRLAEQLVSGIQYYKLSEWYEMTQFDSEIESWQAYLEPAQKSIYDHIIFDSGVEQAFVQEMEHMEEVLLYVKLPGWFVVQTPIGTYNPDWAIVWQERDEHGQPSGKPALCLVRETKGTIDRTQLHIDERRKIECGEKHFQGALGVSYKVVTSARELP